MTVKELIQAEIDKLSEENLYDLYEIVKQFASKKTNKKKELCLNLNLLRFKDRKILPKI